MANFFKCTWCGRALNTAQGLKSHVTRLHKGVLSQTGNAPVPGASSQTFVKTANSDPRLVQDSANTSQRNIGHTAAIQVQVCSEDTQNHDEPFQVRLVEMQQTNPNAKHSCSFGISASASQQQNHNFHVRLAEMRRLNPVVRMIPKGARKVVAEEMVKVVESVILKNDVESWQRLLSFSYGVLKLPGSRVDRKVSLATEIKKNLRIYMENPEDMSGSQALQVRRRVVVSDERMAQQVEAKLAEGEVRGAVQLLCSEDNVAEVSPEILAILRDKHPDSKPDATYPVPPSNQAPNSPPTTALEIVQAVASFPNGSSGGLDGLRPQHLKNLINSANGEIAVKLTTCLARLVDIMLEGKVPEEVCSYLKSAPI